MADNLQTLVQTLPIELFEEIFELTLTALDEEGRLSSDEVTEPYTINESYKPSVLLHINKTTRTRFANSFYNDTSTFHMSSAVATKWIPSLPAYHLRLIQEIRTSDVMAHCWLTYEGGMRRWRVVLTVRGVSLDKDESAVLRDRWRISDTYRPNVVQIRAKIGDKGTEWMAFDSVMYHWSRGIDGSTSR